VETLNRSLNTSLTTLLVVLALLFFVGATIQNFAVVLLIGIIAGTFSSICIAPNLLIVWERGEWGRLFKRTSQPAITANNQ
jgi:preprotein translocase subunit SecF